MVCPVFLLFSYWGCISDLATAVLDVNAPQKHAQHLSCGNDNVDHQVEIADVQSGVGMM
jgi:hypothetical protein